MAKPRRITPSMDAESSNSVSPNRLSNCRADVAPTETRCPDPSSSKDRAVQEFDEFRKSGPPSRIFFFENNNWVEFPKQVLDKLTASFSIEKPMFELSAGGNNYLFDFLRMVRFDLMTEVCTSIAWIDAEDKCFFPDKTRPEIAERIDNMRSMGSSGQLRSHSDNVVENLFLNGMRKLAPNTIVTKVYNCSSSDFSWSLREKRFLMVLDMTREARKDASLKFGWYGLSPDDVDVIVKHGFVKPNTDMLDFHGHGVHLSPQHAPYASSRLSWADSKGERHIVLCRVIMGKSERVAAGSAQSHPSNEIFDSGVDNLENPKWYIVWSTHMNTHILPQYVVSFKSFNKPQGLRGPVTCARMRTGPVRFDVLLSGLVGSLPSSRMRALEMLCKDHLVGRIDKLALIRHLRSLVGDGLLRSTIKRLRNHQ